MHFFIGNPGFNLITFTFIKNSNYGRKSLLEMIRQNIAGWCQQTFENKNLCLLTTPSKVFYFITRLILTNSDWKPPCLFQCPGKIKIAINDFTQSITNNNAQHKQSIKNGKGCNKDRFRFVFCFSKFFSFLPDFLSHEKLTKKLRNNNAKQILDLLK